MSASQTPALHAIALQRPGVLDGYEQEVGCMLARWPEPKRHLAVNRLMDEIRSLGSALTGLHSAWAELPIVHAELVQALLRSGDAVDARKLGPYSGLKPMACSTAPTRS